MKFNLLDKMQYFNVDNMETDTGNRAPNQFKLSLDGLVVFKSYGSVIVVLDYNNSIITFGRDWDYSRTTLKYLRYFLDEQIHLSLGKKDIEYYIGEGQLVTRFKHWIIDYNDCL